jgi:hypothetical protein
MGDTLGNRIFLAHLELERREGRRINYEELGAMIAEEEGRETAYSSGNVYRWEHDKKTPSLEAIAALARLSGLSAGFIGFGERPGESARAPTGTPPAPEPPATGGPRELPTAGYRRVAESKPKSRGRSSRDKPKGRGGHAAAPSHHEAHGGKRR